MAMEKFLGLFGDKQDVAKEFGIDKVPGLVVVAAYEYEEYSGDAYVLYIHEGKILEVFGSHCSCYGLENQWEPELTTPEALLMRLESNPGYGIVNSREVQREILVFLRAFTEELKRKLAHLQEELKIEEGLQALEEAL